MSFTNWVNVLWVAFDASDECQHWPAAVLSAGQLVYIGTNADVNDYAVLEEFQGTAEDVEKRTGGYRSKELDFAVRLARQFKDGKKECE